MSAKREIRKREILEQGFQVLYRNGYAATGVQEIADASGIPKGSFYNYFESKEHFAVDAINLYADRLLAVEAEALLPESGADSPTNSPFYADSSIPPIERILLFFQRLAEYHEQRGQPGPGCLVGNMSQEMGSHSDLLAAAVTRFFSEFRRPIEDCLRAAWQDRSAASPALDPELMAGLIVDGYQGALVRMKAERSTVPLFDLHRSLAQILRA